MSGILYHYANVVDAMGLFDYSVFHLPKLVYCSNGGGSDLEWRPREEVCPTRAAAVEVGRSVVLHWNAENIIITLDVAV